MFYKYHLRKQKVGVELEINDAGFQTVRGILDIQ